MTAQDWKQHAPCRGADPVLFEVPDRSDTAGWDQLRVTAETWCKPCPLIQFCAVDPDGRFGLWAGTARWERQSAPQWEPLFDGAPTPQIDRSQTLAFGPWLPSRKRSAA